MPQVDSTDKIDNNDNNEYHVNRTSGDDWYKAVEKATYSITQFLKHFYNA